MATRPTFNPHDQDRLLRAMGEARRELCDAAIKMQSRSLTKAGAQTVIGNIDEMAFLLTGYRKFYQGKPPHSTSWTTPATPPPNDPE